MIGKEACNANAYFRFICLLFLSSSMAAQPGYALLNLQALPGETGNCVSLTWLAEGAQQPEDECPHYQIYRARPGTPYTPIARLEAAGFTQRTIYNFQDCNFCVEPGNVVYRVEYVVDISGWCDESVLDTLFSYDAGLANFPCLRAVSACEVALAASIGTDGASLTYCLPADSRQAAIEAYDVAGRRLMSQDLPLVGTGVSSTGKLDWDPQLAAGCYLVLLRNDRGIVAATKLLW